MSDIQKFRKKPVVVEAMRWDGTVSSADKILTWIRENDGAAAFFREMSETRDPHGTLVIAATPAEISIVTLEGPMRADAGDYIIRGVKGEFYPCKPDIFAVTYDSVDDEQLRRMG